jgi:hypothetical protein
VSENYEFIPTHEVLDLMESRGFRCVYATQQATAGTKEFKRHMLRFRHDAFTTGFGAPRDHKIHEHVPEICLINSHDRTSRYILSMGVFRLICANGLMVIDPNIPTSIIRVMHLTKQADLNSIIKASDQIIESGALLSTRIKQFKDFQLDIGQQLEFATKALELRYGNHAPTISTDALLKARRKEDEGTDLWRTLNRIQENFTHGTQEGKHQSRPLVSLAESVKVNQGLWKLAATFCDASKN